MRPRCSIQIVAVLCALGLNGTAQGLDRQGVTSTNDGGSSSSRVDAPSAGAIVTPEDKALGMGRNGRQAGSGDVDDDGSTSNDSLSRHDGMSVDPGRSSDPELSVDPGRSNDPKLSVDPGRSNDPKLSVDPGRSNDRKLRVDPRPSNDGK